MSDNTIDTAPEKLLPDLSVYKEGSYAEVINRTGTVEDFMSVMMVLPLELVNFIVKAVCPMSVTLASRKHTWSLTGAGCCKLRTFSGALATMHL